MVLKHTSDTPQSISYVLNSGFNQNFWFKNMAIAAGDS